MTSTKTWQRGTRPRSTRLSVFRSVTTPWSATTSSPAAYGSSERALNRGDAAGAPYTYVAGVKYRPERGYQEFLTSQIQRRGAKPKRRASKLRSRS